MPFAPALALATVVWQVIDFLRELAHIKENKSAVLTQATAWVGGVIVVMLAAQSDLFNGFQVGSVVLSHLNTGSQVFFGLIVSSLASTGVDIKQAIDSRDTSAKPPLVASSTPPVTA